jgi:hypothetical protein
MAEVRTQFFQTTGAGFLHEINLWTLVSDTVSGDVNVEHAWSYTDPFGQGKPDSGVTIVPVQTFLMGSAADSVKEKLRAALRGTNEPK